MNALGAPATPLPIAQGPVLCPSGRCAEGNLLLGVVREDGAVSFLAGPVPVDREFAHVASQGRPAQTRFRFAEACLRSACGQWTGERCGVIDRLQEQTAASPPPPLPGDGLPECSIRPVCRWFGQSGPAACAICPWVITHLPPQADGPAAAPFATVP